MDIKVSYSEMPKAVKLAVLAMVASYLYIAATLVYFSVFIKYDGAFHDFIFNTAVFGLALYGVLKRSSKTRFVWALVVCVGTVLWIYYFVIYRGLWTKSLMGSFSILTQILSVILLYSRNARQWFKKDDGHK